MRTACRLVSSAAIQVRAKYLVGCDGGSSTVRKQIGMRLEGQGRIRQIHQTFFRSNELFDAISIGKGRHYYFPTGTVVQDDLRHFMIGKGPRRSIRQCSPVDLRLSRHHGRCRAAEPQRLEPESSGSRSYGECRVLLAGNSMHLVIPNGGLGMNTGVGDAVDLSWKLAGTLQGWGGPICWRATRPSGGRSACAIGQASGRARRRRAVVEAACSPGTSRSSRRRARPSATGPRACHSSASASATR